MTAGKCARFGASGGRARGRARWATTLCSAASYTGAPTPCSQRQTEALISVVDCTYRRTHGYDLLRRAPTNPRTGCTCHRHPHTYSRESYWRSSRAKVGAATAAQTGTRLPHDLQGRTQRWGAARAAGWQAWLETALARLWAGICAQAKGRAMLSLRARSCRHPVPPASHHHHPPGQLHSFIPGSHVPPPARGAVKSWTRQRACEPAQGSAGSLAAGCTGGQCCCSWA